MSRMKKYIQKVNDNIDKAQDLRNTMAIKALASIGVFISCYFLHAYETMNWLLYLTQVCSVFYFVYNSIVASIITYIEFVVISKVEAVSFGKGMTQSVVEQARDLAVEKARELKKD